MNNPLVSILIPVYNVEAYLPQCLDSVLRQTYQNLQIVLIDDGSKDGSWKIMQEYAAKDSRIEIYHQENQGVATTRNHLLEKIKGEYVLFVDSDDWIEGEMVESLVTLSNEYDSPFIMCDRVVNDAKPKAVPQRVEVLSQEKAIHDFLRHEYFIGSLWNKLIKTILLHNEKFHCGISYGEDALFCWRVLQNTNCVVVTNRQLYHYRMNESSISHESFGPKKFSGQKTWQIIGEESKNKWSRYSYYAYAQLAIQNIDLIHSAIKNQYPYCEMLSSLQENARRYFKDLIISKRVSVLKLIYGYVIVRWYGFGLLLNKLWKI